MDDVPEREDDQESRADPAVPRPESTGPATDRVRIVGAEPAGEATAVVPVVSRHPGPDDGGGPDDDGPGHSSVRLTGEPGNQDGVPAVQPLTPGQTAVPSTASSTELPHWTEPPTGQVPAVLSRDTGTEPSGIGTPTWREEDADWMAHDEEFEPAMFGDEQVALGSLDETEGSDPDRRPWEFDLDSVRPGDASPVRTSSAADAEAGDTIEPITEPVPVVPAASGGTDVPPVGSDRPPVSTPSLLFGETEPAPAPAPAAAAGAAAGIGSASLRDDADPPTFDRSVPDGVGSPDADDPEGDKARPTGATRSGRARRTGLLAARMRAKRPDDMDLTTEAPLAAEPPGASVTDVPGAGRKRGGLASLAAADRSAVRDEEVESPAGADTTADRVRPAPDGVDIAATAAVAAGVPRRRPSRWSASDSASRSGSPAGGSASTGGGPPPRRLRGNEPGTTGPGRATPAPTGSIGVRIGTGIAVAVIALVAFKLGTVTSLVLCLIVVTFAAGECFGVLRRAGYHPATLLGLVGTISLMVGAYNKGIAAVPLVLVLITAFTLIWYLFGIERGSPVAGTAATLLTVGWVSLLGTYAGLLLSPSLFPDRHGIAFLLGAIIATVANDVGALVIGGGMGRHPLAPTISPNKTWEGLVGGALFSILASVVVVGQIHPWTPSNAALLGLVVAVVAPIGDLCESLLKRDLQLKDMGRLLPGHGGVLDRVDALLFVLPATYYLVRALNIA